MTTIKGHFDGRVIVLDEPAELRVDEPVLIQRTTPRPAEKKNGLSGAEFVAAAQGVNIEPTDLDQMEQAIEQGCERIDPPQDHAW